MTDRPTWRDAAALGFASSLGPFAVNAYVPGFFEMADDFGVSFVAVQQTMTVYLAGFALAALVVGALSDALGRRTVLLAGMALFIAATIAALAAPAFWIFNVCRVIQGMGAAVGQVVTLAMVRDRWQGLDAAKMNGLIAMFFAVSPALAPVVGGFLVVHGSWHAVFLFLIGYAAAVAAVVEWVLSETLPKDRRRPFRAGALFSDYRRVLACRPFVAGALAHGFCFMGGILYSAGAADFAVHILGLGLDEFGWLTVPLAVTGIAGSWASPYLAKSFGAERMLLATAFLTAAAAGAGALLEWRFAWGFPLALVTPAVYFFTMSVARPVLQVFNLDFFPQNRGTAASVQQFFATGSFAVCTSLWVPLVLGSAAKYALVAAFCGVMVFGLSRILLSARRR